MINLLKSVPPEHEIAAILAETAGRPALPPFGSPQWSTVRNNPSVSTWLLHKTERAIKEAAEPLPPLPDELYAHFHQTGLRLPFEEVYFERRRRLGRAALALLLGDGSHADLLRESFLRKLGEIMDETSWALPAHVWTEPSGKDPLQIDLFGAETANNLADMIVVFGKIIPEDLTQRIKTRLRVQFFENYVNRQPPFHWAALPMNWNAVCHQGVLGAALAIETDHALVARLLARAAAALPVFLSGFGNDGSTSEGPAYWAYGFGWFTELNAQLEHRTGGRLSLFEGDAHIARIARFAPALTLSEGHFVNFSDGHQKGRLSPSLLSYLGQRLGDPVLTAQGVALYRHLSETEADLDATRADFFCFTRLALRAPSPELLANAREPKQPDVFFKDYGAMVVRGTDAQGRRWEFAAKGGHNAEHHNHNDCGSFLLNVDGTPALIEIGAPEYTHDFFNPATRYTCLAARSLGHSVPWINGVEQGTGAEFAATVLKTDLAGERVEFVIDLTRCYPAEARCKRLHRTFVLEKTAGRLSMTDSFELDGPGTIESMLICQDPVVQDGGGALITTPKNRVRVVPAGGTTLTTIETCDYRGHKGTDEHVHRLRFAPAASGAAGTISYEVTME